MNFHNSLTSAAHNLNDSELVRRYQAHQEASVLELLLTRHKDTIAALSYRFGSRTSTSEDLQQDLFLILADKLPKASSVQNFRAWLSTLVRNRLIDEKRRGDSFDRYQNYQKQRPGFYQEALDSDMDEQKLVELAMALLNARERKCVRLFYLEGKTYHEIAEELGWTFRQVTGLMYRAMKRMRQGLGTTYGQYYHN